MGACVAGIALTAGPSYSRFIDYVEHDLKDRLRGLRASTENLRRRINMWLAIMGGVFFSLWIGIDSFVLALLVVVIMGLGPWYVVRRMARKRRQKIEDQMADALVTFSSGIRAGLSIAQSLQMLADECPKPINQEFAQIVGEYKLGKPIERTLTEAKARLRSENFILFAAALLASRESGGRLNETVERISKSVLELQRLERKVMTETAQARKSSVYMACVPFLVLAVYAVVDPFNVRLLFTTLPGQIMLAISILLNLLAYLWANKILDADI
jgi:tight adherence protein B